MDYPWLKFYEPGVPHQIDIPDWILPQLLDRSVQSPEKTAIIYFGKEISYFHLYNLVNRFTAGLQNCGIQKGDRVILALPNIPQLIIAYWAVLKIGAIAVLVNPLLSGSELEYQIHACGAKTAVFWDRNLKKYHPDTVKDLELIIAAGVETYMPFFMNMAFQIKKAFEEVKKQSRLPQKVLLFRELLSGHSPNVHAPLPLPDDPAVILFTGGVTGTPKPAVLSHRNLIANMLQAKSWITDFREGEVIVGALPLIHSYGMTACNHLAVGTKSTLLLYPRFQIKHIVDDMIKFNSGVFPGVPTMYAAILEEVKRRELESLPIRICISGGAPLPVSLQNNFEKITGAHLVEGFGLTEASPVTHCNPIRGINKKNSIGIPWPNTEARIVDRKTGTELETNKIGELQIRGPQVMQSYWQDAGGGSDVKDADGWLRTGDFAYKDTDGYFYIADRIKDVIFYGGESIYPSEIEKLLSRHPHIREAAVIGVVDDYYGQVIKALVVQDGTGTVSENEVIRYCSEHLAKFKVPRYVEFVEKLPKNYLGKVLKRQLS